jgi:hypothetical protein
MTRGGGFLQISASDLSLRSSQSISPQKENSSLSTISSVAMVAIVSIQPLLSQHITTQEMESIRQFAGSRTSVLWASFKSKGAL